MRFSGKSRKKKEDTLPDSVQFYKEIEIMAWCSSEKEPVSLGFGACCSAEEFPDGLSPDWIYVGIEESFWENYEEFEPGIDKARQIAENNPSVTIEEALFEVFGCFDLTYEVDGAEKECLYAVDVNSEIYLLLKEIW